MLQKAKDLTKYPTWYITDIVAGSLGIIAYWVVGGSTDQNTGATVMLIFWSVGLATMVAGYLTGLEVAKFNAARDLGIAIVAAGDRQLATFIAMAQAIGYTAQVQAAFKVLGQIWSNDKVDNPSDGGSQVLPSDRLIRTEDGETFTMAFAVEMLQGITAGEKLPPMANHPKKRKFQALVHDLDKAGLVLVQGGRAGTVLAVSRNTLLKGLQMLAQGRDPEYVKSWLDSYAKRVRA